MPTNPLIAILHRVDGSDVRIGKTCRTLTKNGYHVDFIGWDKNPHKKKTIDLGGATSSTLKYPTKNGRATILGTAKYVIYCYKKILSTKPSVVCAVNEDLALCFLPLRLFTRTRLICDIFDPIDDRNSHKTFMFKWGSRSIAFLARLGCHCLIATDENRKKRLNRFSAKAVVVQNMPEDPGPELSKTLPSGKVKIFVGGSLHKRRGVNKILEAVATLPDIELISAGWARDESSEAFIQHPKVQFHGIVTLAKSLELASKCDAIFCFYEPVTNNNINASPNKIFDALSVGRPSIINSETKVAEWVETNGFGYKCDYHDQSELSRIIGSLGDSRKSLKQLAPVWYSIFIKSYSWERMEPLLLRAYAPGNQETTKAKLNIK